MLTWAETWGSTPDERARSYPAADLVPGHLLYRAVDVDAPAATSFRWLCQLRVAPYSYDLVDNFGRRSPRALTPGLERLAVGQRFMTIFELAAFEPGRSITLVLRKGSKLFGRLAVTYDVRPQGTDRSRLLAVLSVTRPHPALTWGDLFMMRKQLLTLARLARDDSAGGAKPQQAQHG